MTDTAYTATVTTVIYRGERLELQDVMTFSMVDQAFVDFLTGSCRLVLNKLLRMPTNDAADAWNLHYQTKVVNSGTGEVVLNRPMISFPPMSKAQVHEFLKLAIEELIIANDLRYAEHDDTPKLRREWPMWKAVKLLWSAYVVGGKEGGIR